MITILKRTLMIHARNRAGILFSLLSAFLVFLICVVFMQDSMINNVMQLSPSSSRDQVSWMISCWVMAGLLSITPVTTSCGVLVFMVMDREKKIIKDFKSSPLRKFDYPLGLVLAAVIFSFLITVLIGAVYMVYIGIRTGHWFSPAQLLMALGVILLTSLVSACLNGCLICHFQTQSAFSSFSILLGTTIGFLNGIYIPLGSLPVVVRRFVQIFPYGGAAASLRDILCKNSAAAVFEGAPATALADFREYFGIDYVIGGKLIPHPYLLLYMAAFGIVGFILFIRWFNSRQEMY